MTGFVKVTKAQFYAGVGSRNVHPSIINQRYPYSSDWHEGTRLIGAIRASAIAPAAAPADYWLLSELAAIAPAASVPSVRMAQDVFNFGV